MKLDQLTSLLKDLKLQKKELIIAAILLLSVLIAVGLFFSRTKQAVINTSQLSSYSKTVTKEGVSYFNLNSESGNLYKSNKLDEQALKDFLNQNTTDASGRRLIPKNINTNSHIERVSESSSSEFRKQHYFLKRLRKK